MSETYGDAQASARQALASARLADPDEHFPYKTADAKAALKRRMAPDASTKDDVTGADYTSTRIIEASEAYVTAQEAYLSDPSRANRSAYEAARDDLVAARRTHRRSRVDDDGNPIGNIVGITAAGRQSHHVGPRLRRVGEE